MIDDQTLSEWKQIVDAATPGPWRKSIWVKPTPNSWWETSLEPYWVDDEEHVITSESTKEPISGTFDYNYGGIEKEVDREFIVMARNAIPQLISSYEKLKAENERLAQFVNCKGKQSDL